MKGRKHDMGYTKIPNELMEMIYSKALNYSETKILAYMARKIYGFHKETDTISYSQIQKSLDLGRTTVIDSLKRLQLVGIVVLVKRGKSKKTANEWRLDYSNLTTKLVGIGELVRFDTNKLVGITNHTKESITKEKPSNAVNNELLDDKTRAWELYSKPYLEEKRISDPYFIQATREIYLSKAKASTEKAVRTFIDKQKEYTPPDEYFDFEKDFPKGKTV